MPLDSSRPERAELSSVATTLDQLTARVAAIAEALAGEDEANAPELFEIERGLQAAARRLAKLVGEE